MIGTKNGKWLLAGGLALSCFVNSLDAQAIESSEIKEKIEHIVEWKKEDSKQAVDAPLLSNEFLKNAGHTVADWYPFGMGRMGYPDNYDAYIAVINEKVEERYKTPQKLSESKATEWHRIALAYLASGGDATNVAGHNLIADGTYNRGNTADLGSQGLNGLIWGLITLDAMRYNVPKDAHDTRVTIIERILAAQLPNGAFAFDQKQADVDMTAMAITALAPYYNSTKTFTYEQKHTHKRVSKSVHTVIQEALNWLSSKQLVDGDFKSGGVANVESTAQVLVALTALQIDPEKDERFMKNSNSIVDGLLKYEHEDGGFIHANTYNVHNPTAKPDEVNSMASEQALYALVALYRQKEEERTLYDLRRAPSATAKVRIDEAESSIEQLKKAPHTIKQAIKAYEHVPLTERRYVDNYDTLIAVAKKQGMTLPVDDLTKNSAKQHHTSPLPSFFDATMSTNDHITASDVSAVQQLLKEPVSTAQEVAVATYKQQWQHAKNADQYKELRKQINDRFQAIQQLQKKIKKLNERILDQLYPFSELTTDDAENVAAIMKVYETLPAYDKHQVLQYEDVEKAEAQIQSLQRATYLKVGGSGIAILLIALLIWWRKRRKDLSE